jgi:hypothetical protein
MNVAGDGARSGIRPENFGSLIGEVAADGKRLGALFPDQAQGVTGM